ncbi:PEPxxWA-CTERM sorting domain-containing protein [Erythrobacter sp. W53]|uniref:PEPxxWA-CTERM sorting domain-containing protein n=1 Tax=Erythrobacteraceae TaxID=335929 RepID=UPI0036D28AF2
MKKLALLAPIGLVAGLAAAPAQAALVLDEPCDTALIAPTASACSGYWEGNLLGGSPVKVQDQIDAIDMLPSSFVFNGDWGPVDATKITSLANGNELDFGQMLFGETIIGAHFGNVAGPAGNVTVFWLFDFGTTGASSVALNNAMGFSNSVLYTTGTNAVPEPGTWLMMILGFGLIGGAMRGRKTKIAGPRVTYS